MTDSTLTSRVNLVSMNERHPRSYPIKVQLIVRDHCPICEQVQQQLEDYARIRGGIALEVLNVEREDKTPNGIQPFITPAIWVNGGLWFLGVFDVDRFDKQINRLIDKISHETLTGNEN